MPNINSIYRGQLIDDAIKALNNFKPQILVSGVDASSTVNCTVNGNTVSATSDSSGNCTFDILAYGTYTISGLVSDVITTETITVDKVKKYSVALDS